MKKFNIAVVQTKPKLCDVEYNLKRAVDYIKEAANKKAKFVCLPELFDSGYDLLWVRRFAKESAVKTIDTLRELANELDIYVIAGIGNKRGDNIFNSSFLFGPKGHAAIYDKNYLFRAKPQEEHHFFQEGNGVNVVPTPFGKIGFAICNDLRYPELFSKQALMGVKIIFVSAAWSELRSEHWKVLLKARAIENQIYIAAANQSGEAGKISLFGHSAVIDYDGKVLAEKKKGAGVVIAGVDYDRIEKKRKELPSFKAFSNKHHTNKID